MLLKFYLFIFSPDLSPVLIALFSVFPFSYIFFLSPYFFSKKKKKERKKEGGKLVSYTYSIRSSSTLIPRHLLHRALYLHQIDILVPQLNHAVEDGLHLGELVLVPGDEVQVLGHR